MSVCVHTDPIDPLAIATWVRRHPLKYADFLDGGWYHWMRDGYEAFAVLELLAEGITITTERQPLVVLMEHPRITAIYQGRVAEYDHMHERGGNR